MSRLDGLLPWNWARSITAAWPTCQKWTVTGGASAAGRALSRALACCY